MSWAPTNREGFPTTTRSRLAWSGFNNCEVSTLSMIPRTLFLVLLCCASTLGQTGTAVPSLAPFDQLINTLLTKYGIPGGSIALTQNGRLVFARGYGYADPQAQIDAQPDSRYRIASLSKAITAVTVLHLVEQGSLNLDQPAFALLPDLQPPAGATPDARLASITIRN